MDGIEGVPLAVRPGERAWSGADTRRVVLAGGTLVVGGIVASGGVPSIEREVFAAVNGLSDGLYPALWLPMQVGSLAGGAALAVALGAGTKRAAVAAWSVGAVTSAWLVAKEIKDLVERGRPIEAGLEAVVRETSEGLGYVSGHTAVAFALWTMAAPHLKARWQPWALGLAAVVGISRVYVGAHLPLDVVGGACLGVLVGEAFRRLEDAHHSGQLPWQTRPATT